MSKIIKTVAVFAFAVAIVVFAAPLAFALTGLVTGTLVSAATLAIVTSTIVGIGISLGLTALGGLFRKTPASLSQSMGDRLNGSIVPTAPRKIVFGLTAGGNDIRFNENYNPKKDRQAVIVALASHRINGIVSWYADDDLTWSNGPGLIAHRDGFNSWNCILEGSHANALNFGSYGYWTAPGCSFTGCAYLLLDYKLSTDAWPQGLPSRTTAVVEGCQLYDPRRDSTNGGSGTHRVADQNTWEYKNDGGDIGRNPALALLTYLIGYRINGKLAWGMGVPVSRINFDNFRLYANICEEGVALQAGGTVQRYTFDGIFSTADSHETVFSSITAAMGSCKLTDVGGQYQLVGGYDDTLGPIQAFSADDLVGAPESPIPYIWTPAQSSRDSFNIVTGRFADPGAQYAISTWGTIEIDPLADGIPRTMTLDLAGVSRPETCQRIAKQFLLREALTPGVFAATFGPRAFLVQVGSLCSLSLPAQGWNNKLFRVIEQTETHDLLFTMTLREESAEIYAWDMEEKPLPPSIRPPGYDPNDTIAVQGLTLNTSAFAGVS